VRELSQLGHFNPETIKPDVVPHPEDGTVDINYELEERANDQVELSGGWVQVCCRDCRIKILKLFCSEYHQ